MKEPKKPSIKDMRAYKSKDDITLFCDYDLDVYRLIKFQNGSCRGELLDEFDDLEHAQFMKFMCSIVALYVDERN